MTSFEAYLHNPWSQPNVAERGAIACVLQREKAVRGVNVRRVATDSVREIFDRSTAGGPSLEETGLKVRFAELEKCVKGNAYGIACMLVLAFCEDPIDITSYQTVENGVIDLTDRSVARCLIQEHLGFGQTYRLIKEIPDVDSWIDRVKQEVAKEKV